MTAEGTCVHPVREQLPWYLNGSLDGPESAAVSEHLDSCAECSAELLELSSFAAGLDRHGLPPPQTATAAGSSEAWRFRLAAALAAGLLIPAIVGIYWAILGFPRGERAASPPAPANPTPAETPRAEQPAPPTLAVAVALDLGGGAPRGGPDLPALASPGRSQVVVLTFRRPLALQGKSHLELRDSAGAALARVEAEPGTDRSGRSTCVVPASLLERPGEYSLVFVHAGPPGPREFAYPFRVAAP